MGKKKRGFHKSCRVLVGVPRCCLSRVTNMRNSRWRGWGSTLVLWGRTF